MKLQARDITTGRLFPIESPSIAEAMTNNRGLNNFQELRY